MPFGQVFFNILSFLRRKGKVFVGYLNYVGFVIIMVEKKTLRFFGNQHINRKGCGSGFVKSEHRQLFPGEGFLCGDADVWCYSLSG